MFVFVVHVDVQTLSQHRSHAMLHLLDAYLDHHDDQKRKTHDNE